MSWPVKKMLLEFAVNELARSSFNHVLQFLREDGQTSQEKLLAAAVAASLEQSSTQIDGGILNTVRMDPYSTSFCRISSTSLESLIQDIGSIMADEKCSYLSLQEGLLFVLSILCQPETSVPPYELMEPSVTLEYLGKIIQALATLSSERISWPSPSECHEIAENFEANYGFPGVVGILVSCKLPIRLNNNKKLKDFYDVTLNFPAIAIQIVMNNHGSMIDVCVGLPGSWSPSEVLRSSRLFSRLVQSETQDESLLLSEGHHLLAGPEYPQLPTLITPYNLEVTEATQMRSCFNRMHGGALNSGLDALSNFLDKFSRLKILHLDENFNPMKPEFQLGEDPCHSAAVITLAACVLHNASCEY